MFRRAKEIRPWPKSLATALLGRAEFLPTKTQNSVKSAVEAFQQQQTTLINPTLIELVTFSHMLQRDHSDWSLVISNRKVRVIPKLHSQSKLIFSDQPEVRHKFTNHVENYIQDRIRNSDAFLEGSPEETVGTTLDESTSGRMLLLKQVTALNYDPIFGLTRADVRFCPTLLISPPIVRLKQSAKLCGLYDLAHQLNEKIT